MIKLRRTGTGVKRFYTSGNRSYNRCISARRPSPPKGVNEIFKLVKPCAKP